MESNGKKLSFMRVIDGKVLCALCRRPFLVDMAYRCFVCKEYFCESCSEEHFSVDENI